MHKPWFQAKRYGWGWGLPLTWQSWLIYLGYFGYLTYLFVTTDQQSHSASDTLYGVSLQFIIATIILIVICFMTGEKPRWRWGK